MHHMLFWLVTVFVVFQKVLVSQNTIFLAISVFYEKCSANNRRKRPIFKHRATSLYKLAARCQN